MMTAFASVELAVEAMKLGATDFLRKPMTPEVVRNAVAAAVEKVAKPSGEVENGDGRSEKAGSKIVTQLGLEKLAQQRGKNE
jgi:FixJ family two-component response regulator